MSEDTQKLRKMIENALADGVLSRAESEMIKREIYADKKLLLKKLDFGKIYKEKYLTEK